MKDIKNKYMDMVRLVPDEIKEEINLTFTISNKIDELMRERELSKKQFADQIGRRPSEIIRWLSGQLQFHRIHSRYVIGIFWQINYLGVTLALFIHIKHNIW